MYLEPEQLIMVSIYPKQVYSVCPCVDFVDYNGTCACCVKEIYSA